MNLRDLIFNVEFEGDARPVMQMDRATDELADSAVDATSEIRNMSNATDNSNNPRNLRNMRDGVNSLRNSADAAVAKLQALSKQMGKVGNDLTKKLTLPIVDLGTKAIHTVAKFDDSMSKVQALSGATTQEFKSMRDMAKDLGSTTAHSAKQNWSVVEKSAA